MSNSPLVDYIRISPNKTSPRTQKIDRITIHHMAGNLTVEACGAGFAESSRKASSNYGIGSDGRVGMYVDEKDRSWASSSGMNDNRAVTIEVANSHASEPWLVSDAAYEKLIRLCVDICQRNGIERLNYTGDTSGNLTMHCWFAATACPGTYLKGKFPEIAEEVNRRLSVAEPAIDDGVEVDYYGKVTASALNCRACPNGAIVSSYQNGAVVHISREKNSWGLTPDGWVSLEWIAKVDPPGETKEGDMDISKLTNEQCYEIIQKAQAHAETLPLPDWAAKEFNQADFDGITDGTRPQAFVTRCEAAIMANRAKGGKK